MKRRDFLKVALFRIRPEKTSRIEALETCNLHGTWMSDPVTVVV